MRLLSWITLALWRWVITALGHRKSAAGYDNTILIRFWKGIGIVARNLFWLSDEQWKRIEPHLPTDVRGVERADDRRVISVLCMC